MLWLAGLIDFNVHYLYARMRSNETFPPSLSPQSQASPAQPSLALLPWPALPWPALRIALHGTLHTTCKRDPRLARRTRTTPFPQPAPLDAELISLADPFSATAVSLPAHANPPLRVYNTVSNSTHLEAFAAEGESRRRNQTRPDPPNPATHRSPYNPIRIDPIRITVIHPHHPPIMSPQRPFFLSGFFAAFRQQPGPSLPSSSPQQTATSTTTSSANNKHTSPSTTATSYSVSTPSTNPSSSRGIATAAQAAAAAAAAAAAHQSQTARLQPSRGIPIPHPQPRRRGSDSSSEGFREVTGADRMYIGGKTAGGEERFFKLGVVRRVRSGDRLSIDRMSL